jgi:hypothetical protein
MTDERLDILLAEIRADRVILFPADVLIETLFALEAERKIVRKLLDNREDGQ